ncbi:hypothetical protein ACTTBA_14840 [Shewanella frigidimarina]|uniref:hypothetical protein n=1 Tax=Shewanella frigidimarina TaxID=56812 RepID=UPI003FA18939|tara:strand:- start:51 stop:515 length:465 start_codon:yes stop_codon:yes gene_type:complete
MNLDWLYPTSISVLLIFIGWKVVFNNAKKIASRNETYAIVNRIITLLGDIQKLSESFWLQAQFQEQPQYYDLLTLSKIKLIRAKLQILDNRQVDTNDIQTLIFPIRKACTFNSYKVASLSENEKREQIQSILNATSEFETLLDEKMKTIFPPNY